MAFSMPDLHSYGTNNIYFIAVGIVVASLVAANTIQWSRLDAIPTVGSNGWVESWWAGFDFSKNGLNILQEGYAKYKHRPFKMANRYHWLVVVSSREHIEELRRAPDDQFSFINAVRDRMTGDYTLGSVLFSNSYHIPIVRSKLSRNIGILSAEIREEVVTSFDEVLDLKRDEWKSVPALSTIQKVVFWTSNKFVVGPPLCRDPDWMELNIENALNVVNGVNFLQRFPPFLAPLFSLFITTATQATERGMKFVAPIIAERQRCLDKYGDDWVDKPNDLLSWLMDVAEGKERTAKHLTNRAMNLIFASVHSTSQSFTNALLYLAANPQYAQLLREEVEAVVSQEGWSRAALSKMRKIDSFLKENQRLKGTISGREPESLWRKAVKDYTFSDGTFIPKGTLVSTPSGCLHLDDEYYENASVFNPFRFSDMRDVEGEAAKHQFVSTNAGYLPFGHGRHACPGRFFAANEMKIMLAHTVLSYDVKLPGDSTTIPEGIRTGTLVTVDPNVTVLFRKRK